MPRLITRMRPVLRDAALEGLRNAVTLSYNPRPRSGTAHAISAAAATFFFPGRATRIEVRPMTDPVDSVALSLLPPRLWRSVAEALRRGVAPASLLTRLAADCWSDDLTRVDALRADARAALALANTRGIDVVAWSDAAYPIALSTIADAPAVLWTRGRLASLNGHAVAIVGSRAASEYALMVAEQLAHDLAARGLTIVSGLARGVDSAAHRGALAAGGVTIGVLGCGVDVIYPREHSSLAAQIGASGAVISELVPGTPPAPFFFPLRNRIISGLSRAVVVVEANEKSGSLITARCALEQGRDVLAVPGNVLTGRNRGAHALLRDGARIVESADDVLEELGVSAGRSKSDGGAAPTPEDPIVACLVPGEPCDLDAIAERTGIGSTKLLARLFELELQGAIARVGGGRFLRVDRTC
jgi:DNA processing protein